MEKENAQRYIVTDPCYVMDERQYDAICAAGCDFEGQPFPLVTKDKQTGELVTIHAITSTAHGDGVCEYEGDRVGVDSGMLAVIECSESRDVWEYHHYGARFETLSEARTAMRLIAKKM